MACAVSAGQHKTCLIVNWSVATVFILTAQYSVISAQFMACMGSLLYIEKQGWHEATAKGNCCR